MARTAKPRSRYIPKGYNKVKETDLGVVFYQTKPYPAAIAYAGKCMKSTWHYKFTSDEARRERINLFFRTLKAQAKEKAKRAREKAAYDATKEFHPGDVVVNTWGYEQTNQDFYIVNKVTPKSLTLTPIDSDVKHDDIPGGAMSGYATPVKKETGPHRLHRVDRGRVNFRWGSGRKWDGTPQRVSWYG